MDSPQKVFNSRTAPVSSAMSLNDNLDFMGKALHIQTENVQSENPHIRTHVFSRGRVIHTKILSFPADLIESGNLNQIRRLMQAQHCEIIDKISRRQSKLSVGVDS
jgi:hypothetical protein